MATAAKLSTLAVHLNGNPTTTSSYEDILEKLANEGELYTAESKDAAFDILSKHTVTGVLVLDDALASEENLDFARRLVDLAWGGATVVLGGTFSSAEPSKMIALLDRTWGLPWGYEGKRRAETKLNGDAVTAAKRPGLLDSYGQEAVFVSNVERAAAWYETEDKEQAATVLMRFGEGSIGYVGDANGEEGTVKSVLKMFGVAP